MSRVNYTNVVVNVGGGALDAFLAKKDAESARTDIPKQWAFWEEVALAGLGYGAMFMNIPFVSGKIADPIAQTGTTLLSRKVVDYLLNKPAGSTTAHVHAATRVAAAPGRVAWKPTPVGV
jgi:hypothetical protein